MKKMIVTVELKCDYEFNSNEVTEDEAIEKAWDWFMECKPEFTINYEEEE